MSMCYNSITESGNIMKYRDYKVGFTVEVPDYLKVEQVNTTEISISGIDKQKVSEFAANIRKLRKPEPYKGKGIRYKGEHIRRKEGKKAAK